MSTPASSPPQFLPNCYELIIGTPSLSSPASTVQKFKAGLAIQSQHPDFLGVPLEGVCVEEETRALRVLEWKSYEGHMTNFRLGPLYAPFVAARAGAYTGPQSMTHYHLLSPPPKAPVVEHMHLPLLSPAHFPEFSAQFSAALDTYIRPAAGFTGLALGQEVEDPSSALCLLGWERVEDHTEVFRYSAMFDKWREVVGPLFERFLKGGIGGLEMFHVRTCAPGEGVRGGGGM
ncbi:hypothetical protein CALVIDRAFT_565466 [Calocera viscosa TUFC12733]|uniref:ABM domain-containing protein n=1 Tax=Calocera viscosa (strain TUFC12733) TaxID=1330018 RepID=A0A167KK63_CALVF|nr:hypothetical protein CALVIDRAFT_565466 [Calocera viscosa TUFC12733]